jgi:predicted ribosomally synthesized peptide with nif11-like leader
MSVKDVKAFFEKVAQDKDLQKKLKALTEREEAIYSDLVKIAKAEGFEFTAADLAAVRKARPRNAKLSDAELKGVAAGTGGFKGKGVCLLPGSGPRLW